MIRLDQPRPKPQYWQSVYMACKGFWRGNPPRTGDYVQLHNSVIQLLEPKVVETSRVVFATSIGFDFQFAWDQTGGAA